MKKSLYISIFIFCSLVILGCKPDGGDGPTGNTSTQPPPPPTGVSVSKNSMDYISVTWDASNGAEGYEIYRSDGGSYSLVHSTSATSWNDADAIKAKWYNYSVRAYNKGGKSASSSTVSGFKKGMRFENVALFFPTGAGGLRFDLNVFGFKNSTHTVIIYAVYKKVNDDGYYFIPSSTGYGLFGYVAKKYDFTSSNEACLLNHELSIPTSWWHPDYRNNKYPQYLALKVYQTQNPSSLNSSIYDRSSYNGISWNGNSENSQTIIFRELPPNERTINVQEMERFN